MHIDNDKLVGTYVSDRYSEKGTVTIVLTDGDSTPTREYTRYKYVQTEQLTAIGVAIKDYGAVLVPETTIELFTNGTLNPADFGVFVKFNDEYYNVGLSTLLEDEIGAAITFEAGGLDSYAPTTFNATLPPYSVGNAGQVPTVDENGKVGWDDIPEELPSVTGNTGKFLGVNDGATGVEWKNVPAELPAIGDSDAGKVLQVNSGHTGVEWGSIPNELPTIGDSDAGKVLQVNSGHTGVEWSSIPNELPAIGSGDAGKVLKVNASETGTEWGEAGGNLYLHDICWTRKSGTSTYKGFICIQTISSRSSAYTWTSLRTHLGTKKVVANGFCLNSAETAYIIPSRVNVNASNDEFSVTDIHAEIAVEGGTISTVNSSVSLGHSTADAFSDTVTPIS